MTFERIAFDITNGLARITIANEANNNAMDGTFCREFGQAAHVCAEDPAVKAILIGARGPIFGVGGDINEFLSQRARIHDHIHQMADSFHDGITALRNAPAPVLIAVNGMAAGGAFSLVLTADMAIAKRSARFVAAYSRSGLSPDGGGTYFLPRLVGWQRAFDIFATNPTLSADQARELGMISRVVDDDQFETEVEKLAQIVVDSPPGALATLKQLLRRSLTSGLADQLAAEADGIAAQAALPATLERLLAFARRSQT